MRKDEKSMKREVKQEESLKVTRVKGHGGIQDAVRVLAARFVAGRDRVFTYKEVCFAIQNLRDRFDLGVIGAGVTYAEMYRWVQEVRRVLVRTHKLTLVTLQKKGSWGGGYRVATPKEATFWGMRVVRKAILATDRAYEAREVMDHRFIPEAFVVTFDGIEKKVQSIARTAPRFLEVWSKNQAQIAFDFKKGGTENGKNKKG